MSIANYFTFIRLVISPIFLFAYLSPDSLGLNELTLPYFLLGLLTISELSDAFDGYFARLYNQVTDFGKILDPMADSISRTTMFLAFTQPPVNLPVPFIFLFLYRDSVVSTLRTICALKGFALAARMSGKVKAGIQAFSALVVLLLMVLHAEGGITINTLQAVSAWIIGTAALYTVFSAVDYIYSNRKYISRLISLQRNSSLYENDVDV